MDGGKEGRGKEGGSQARGVGRDVCVYLQYTKYALCAYVSICVCAK